ncbi:MAG: hypothetical protein Q9163_002898 [Psora crenata]
MSITPIITFKAGTCEFNASSIPPKVIPKPTPGYIYLFEEDEMINFCWRPRSAPMSSPELQLVMVPTDGRFVPYQEKINTASESNIKSPTNGRIFVLKFQSSSARHLFWLQSKSQHAQGDPAWFSPRDLKLGQIVDRLLQGEEVNVRNEVADVSRGQQGGTGDDAEMEDVRPDGSGDTQGNTDAGDPFIGNPRNEGSGGRNGGAGGAGGGQALDISAGDAGTAVQKFLQSLQNNPVLQNQQHQRPEHIFTTLPELLPPSTTVPVIDSADEALLNSLLSQLPPDLLLLSQETDDESSADPSPEMAKAALEALSLNQKKEILKKVLRSPQFSQSLGSLTQALRDGGLPSISDALNISIANEGYTRPGSGVPLGGGDAVEAFVRGVKSDVLRNNKNDKNDENDGEGMETE